MVADNRRLPNVPLEVIAAFRWWRIAVYVYASALAVTVIDLVRHWEAAVQTSAETFHITEAAAADSLVRNLAWAVAIQGGVAFGCWWVAAKLLEGSAAARMMLSVAAVVFAINAVLNVIGTAGATATERTSTLVYLATGLVALASLIAIAATVASFRGSNNATFFIAD